MSTSDTPLCDSNIIDTVLDDKGTPRRCLGKFIPLDVAHAIERQLNAARAELAERKPQPSGDEQPNNGDVVLTHGDLSSARELGDTEKVNAGSSPAVLPLSNDEQARFEAAYGADPVVNPEHNFWMTAKDAWMACVTAHQPPGAPVAWTVSGLITDFSRDFSAFETKTYTEPLYAADQWPQSRPRGAPLFYLSGYYRAFLENNNEEKVFPLAAEGSFINMNWPNQIELYPASAFPPSPCPHLSTSKEGTSYCMLAESLGKE